MAAIVAFKEIPLGDLIIGFGQTRIRDVEKDIDELADSIEKVGQLEPIVVSPTEYDGKYEIITGQRRFLAHQELNRRMIWAAVLDERVDEITAKVLSVTENLVRRDLHSSDLIDVCTYLYKHYGTIRAVSEETGLAPNKVGKYVKYDQLIPELKNLVDTGRVKIDTALRAQQASQMDAEEAVQFALEMQPMSGAQQTAIVKRRDSNPHLSADDVIEDAKSGGKITQILVRLTTDVHSALGQFAALHQTRIDDAAERLIREGLYLNNMLEDDL